METLIIINAVVSIVTNLAISAIIGALGVGMYLRNKNNLKMRTRAKNGGHK